jgi:hypothetical protein
MRLAYNTDCGQSLLDSTRAWIRPEPELGRSLYSSRVRTFAKLPWAMLFARTGETGYNSVVSTMEEQT